MVHPHTRYRQIINSEIDKTTLKNTGIFTESILIWKNNIEEFQLMLKKGDTFSSISIGDLGFRKNYKIEIPRSINGYTGTIRVNMSEVRYSTSTIVIHNNVTHVIGNDSESTQITVVTIDDVYKFLELKDNVAIQNSHAYINTLSIVDDYSEIELKLCCGNLYRKFTKEQIYPENNHYTWLQRAYNDQTIPYSSENGILDPPLLIADDCTNFISSQIVIGIKPKRQTGFLCQCITIDVAHKLSHSVAMIPLNDCNRYSDSMLYRIIGV